MASVADSLRADMEQAISAVVQEPVVTNKSPAVRSDGAQTGNSRPGSTQLLGVVPEEEAACDDVQPDHPQRVRTTSGRKRTSCRRLRGRERGRGRARTTRVEDDTSNGLTMSLTQCDSIMMEKEFFDNFIQQRARLLCKSAVTNMKLETNVKGLSQKRCGFVVLLMNGVLRQLLDWVNELVRLRSVSQPPFTISDMYRYVAVLLFSHTTGFSFEKAIYVLRQAVSVTPSVDLARFIAANILAYPPIGRGNDGQQTRSAQRDQTQRLTEFESIAFRDTRKIFLIPLHLMATLDYDLFGTRAADNQVKMLSSRKADREGHSADAVADALFRIILALRFRRRGEMQAESVRKLLETMLEGRGEESLSSMIVTADRGYSKEAFMGILTGFGLFSVFLMPDNILRCHLFVGKSYLNSFRGDLEDEHDVGRQDSMNDEGIITGNAHEGYAATNGRNGEEAEIWRSPGAEWYDRRSELVIDEDVHMDPEVFFASRRNSSGRRRTIHNTTTALAVREHCTNKFAKILRFMYTVPQQMQQNLSTWIAVPKSNVALDKTLFSGATHQDAVLQSLRSVAEETLGAVCDVLTLGQRCADWFVLRQFRITGTNAGLLLMSSAALMEVLGYGTGERSTRTAEEWFTLLHKSWLSSKVSTEAMMRGTKNQPAVLSAFESNEIVKAVFEMGILSMKTIRYLPCSPDAVAILDIASFPEWDSFQGLPGSQDGKLVMACVNIKTRVAASTLADAAQLSSPDIIRCRIGDDVFKTYIPREHMGQIVHQALVLKLQFCVYVVAGETGLLYTVLVRIPQPTLSILSSKLISLAAPPVEWACVEELFPSFVDVDSGEMLQTRHRFWQIIDNHVKTNGCFFPLELFKHAAQSFNSKTKAGVDSATQQRAILRSSTSHFKWEQKIVSKTLRNIAVNFCLTWRMFERQDLLESEDSFKSIDNYRNCLDKVQSTADFMFDVAQELLSHAASIQLEEKREDGTEEMAETAGAEAKGLISLAHSKKRNRLTFLNLAEVVALRLTVRGHHTVQGPLTHCALCGQHTQGYRGFRSTFRCNLCGVHLCIKVPAGNRKICAHICNSTKHLEQRRLPARGSSRGSRTGTSTADEGGSANNEAGANPSSRNADSITGLGSENRGVQNMQSLQQNEGQAVANLRQRMKLHRSSRERGQGASRSNGRASKRARTR